MADWSTSTKKVTPKIATAGEVCMFLTTPAKILQQLIPNNVKFVGPCQFGATPQMGVTLASRTLPSFLDVTRLHGHSSAVLYLDLSKAFDLAIGEAILGMPEGLLEDRYLEYLRDNSLTEENIQLPSAALRDKGCALHQAGVSLVVTRLLNSLHTVRDKEGQSLPWMQIVLSNLRLLKSHVIDDSCAWTHLITNFSVQFST